MTPDDAQEVQRKLREQALKSMLLQKQKLAADRGRAVAPSCARHAHAPPAATSSVTGSSLAASAAHDSQGAAVHRAQVGGCAWADALPKEEELLMMPTDSIEVVRQDLKQKFRHLRELRSRHPAPLCFDAGCR